MAEWTASQSDQNPDTTGSGRPWLGVHYVCAGTYGRVILDRSGSFYVASCPKCSKRCTVRVGSGGTSNRMFEMTCSAAPRR